MPVNIIKMKALFHLDVQLNVNFVELCRTHTFTNNITSSPDEERVPSPQRSLQTDILLSLLYQTSVCKHRCHYLFYLVLMEPGMVVVTVTR